MTRTACKAGLIFAVVFTAMIGLIRAQPRDNRDIQRFLTPPDGCPRPCFMGVRPGVTTAVEAAALLRANDWVGDITTYPANEDLKTFRRGWLYFSWSGRQPAYIVDVKPYNLVALRVENHIIQRVGVQTAFSLEDAWLALGQPDWMYSYLSSSRAWYRRMYYGDGSLGLAVSISSCSLPLEDVLKAQTLIMWSGHEPPPLRTVKPTLQRLRRCS